MGTGALKHPVAPQAVAEDQGPTGVGKPIRRVLFLCTHNAVRSPMAAALAAALRRGQALECQSAGVYSSGPVDPDAVAVMAELNLDIARHHPHDMAALEADGDDLGAYDLIIALSAAAAENADAIAAHTPVAVERWPVADPTQSGGVHGPSGGASVRRAAFRALRDQLAARVRARFAA